MNVSETAKEYLSEANERALEYYHSIEYAKEYIMRHMNTMAQENMVDCVLMSILWTTSSRGDDLSEEEVCMFLDVEPETDCSNIEVAIVPEMQGWTLEEVLDYVRETQDTE